MADHIAVASFADEMVGRHGRIDILVNNAVRTDPADGKVADIPSTLWNYMIAANLVGQPSFHATFYPR